MSSRVNSLEKVAEVKRLLTLRFTVRETARMSGVHPSTVYNYRRELVADLRERIAFLLTPKGGRNAK